MFKGVFDRYQEFEEVRQRLKSNVCMITQSEEWIIVHPTRETNLVWVLEHSNARTPCVDDKSGPIGLPENLVFR